MRIAAFDSKDFNRGKVLKIPSESATGATETVFKGYFTPLGVGVTFKNEDLFENGFKTACAKWSKEFGLPPNRPVISSYPIRSQLTLKKAIPLCDRIVTSVADFVDLAFFSWVSLPPNDYPTVEVGGQRSVRTEVPTPKFLRDLAPSFSYITAWNFFGKRNPAEYTALVDGFRGKQTTAWDDLTARTKPQVFPRGDECNPFIAFADLLAFLTDVKLWQQKDKERMLYPENVKAVWDSYPFAVDVRYLDPEVKSKFSWYSNDLIDIGPYLKRPVIFFLADEIEKIELAAPSAIAPTQTELDVQVTSEPRPRKFHEVLQRMDPYLAVTWLAYNRKGSTQFFDRFTDADKVQDGDVMVYMGEHSKRVAAAYADAFEIEVLSARELRRSLRGEEKENLERKD